MRFRAHHQRRVQSSRGFHDRKRLPKVGFCVSLCGSTDSNFYSVVDTLHLANGVLFPIPITLDVSGEVINRLSIQPGSRLSLRDPRDEEPLAIITGLSSLLSVLLESDTNYSRGHI